MMTREIFVNVGRHRLARQRAAFRKVRRELARSGGIVGWAEIGEGDGAINEPAILRKTFSSRRGWANCAVQTHTPVTFRRKAWEVVSVRTHRAMDGIRRVSPHRYIVVTTLRHRATGKIRVRINTHTVAGAFNGRINGQERARVEGWEGHWTLLCHLVAIEHEKGHDVVVSGDFNRQGKDFPELHEDARLVIRRATDRIYAIPAKGRKVQVVRKGDLPIGIDFHRAIYADIKFLNK